MHSFVCIYLSLSNSADIPIIPAMGDPPPNGGSIVIDGKVLKPAGGINPWNFEAGRRIDVQSPIHGFDRLRHPAKGPTFFFRTT